MLAVGTHWRAVIKDSSFQKKGHKASSEARKQSSAAVGVTQSTNGFQRDGGWEGWQIIPAK